MNRRDMLCLVGSSAAGLTVPGLLAAGTGPAPAAAFGPPLHSFHVPKGSTGEPVETSHVCLRLNDDVQQCLLFHGTGPAAKLVGVEYVITHQLYRRLTLEEKKYWHPHAYEVLSGQLLAPDTPAAAEEEAMRERVTSWGKAWHTWPDPDTDLPEGEPVLMWSVTRDGQLDAVALARRDRRLGAASREARTRRQAFGYPVPDVTPPESPAELGRQWADAGPDTPESLRRRGRA